MEKRQHLQDQLVPLIAARLDDDDASFRATAIVATIFTCIDVAADAWVESDGREDLAALVTRAITAIRGDRS